MLKHCRFNAFTWHIYNEIYVLACISMIRYNKFLPEHMCALWKSLIIPTYILYTVQSAKLCNNFSLSLLRLRWSQIDENCNSSKFGRVWAMMDEHFGLFSHLLPTITTSPCVVFHISSEKRKKKTRRSKTCLAIHWNLMRSATDFRFIRLVHDLCNKTFIRLFYGNLSSNLWSMCVFHVLFACLCQQTVLNNILFHKLNWNIR